MLLATKLYIPQRTLTERQQPFIVARPRLVDKLNAGLEGKVTLVCAPAGFGKTTLIADWLSQLTIENSQLTIDNCAWLSLDESDNDPVRFLSYLIAALQTVLPKLGQTAVALLQSPQPPAPETVLTIVINELAAIPTPIILVLGDYHTISTPAIHHAVTFLLDHQPPGLHLVISSRADPLLPLARWRARRELLELRADDLRFSVAEASAFLQQVAGLDISPDDVAVLQDRTEGWVAGLQLAALSLQGRADVSDFIATFAGSHRYIMDYLVEEVLQQRPPGTEQFLLQTAFLDRLCGSLCDAVTGQSNSHATLAQLHRANLFVVPLDDEGNWYRYHHLFAEMLRARLRRSQPDSIPALHHRACQWYEQAGLLDEAIHHALAAPDNELAAALVERHATVLLLRSEAVRVKAWLAQLPNDLIHSRSRLALAQVWILAGASHFDEAERALSMPMFQAADLRPEVAGQVALLRASLARFQDDATTAFEQAQRALDCLPAHSQALRVRALLEIGLAYKRRGDIIAASDSLAEVVALGESGEHQSAALIALEALRMIHARYGRLSQATQTGEQALRLIGRWGEPPIPIAGIAYVGLGIAHCEWNNLAEAGRFLNQGLQLLLGTIEDGTMAHGHIALARVQQAQGNSEGALASLQRAEAWFEQMQIVQPSTAALLAAHRARLWLRQGNLDAAGRWADASGLQVDDELREARESEYLTLVRVFLACGSSEPGKHDLSLARHLLDRLLTAAEATGRLGSMVEILALCALALQARGNLTAARSTLERALTLAEPEGYMRIFVDEGEPMRLLLSYLKTGMQNQAQASPLLAYTDKLLAAFPDPAQSPISDPSTSLRTGLQSPISNLQSSWFEPLSPREQEVLRLIAAGASNREIADTLVVAVSTVKKHISNILSKLNATSRTQAVAQARELGLLL
ncbi:MAG TPA: LuxR C-terminal-related transcriptional regulator [Anaerolineae bacterium]